MIQDLLFSIVIPLYNKEDYIEATLESVLGQQYDHFEVLVVNDGSTDASAALVSSYAQRDPRIRLIEQDNGGVSVARNRGMAEAKAPYYVFLDADDTWSPEHLSEVAALVAAYPEAALLGTAYQRCFNSGPSASIVLAHLEGQRGLVDDYFKYVAQAQFIYTSSIAVAGWAIAEVGGFPEGVRNGEDLHLWTRLALKWPVAYSGVVTVNYASDVAGQATGVVQDFSLEYPRALKEAASQANLSPQQRVIFNQIGLRLALGVSGKFFCQSKVNKDDCLQYLTDSGLLDWVNSWRLYSLRRCPWPVIWRIYFNVRRFWVSRKCLKVLGGVSIRGGIKFKLTTGHPTTAEEL